MLRLLIWLLVSVSFLPAAPQSGGARQQEARSEGCASAFIGFREKENECCGQCLPPPRVDERDADALL